MIQKKWWGIKVLRQTWTDVARCGGSLDEFPFTQEESGEFLLVFCGQVICWMWTLIYVHHQHVPDMSTCPQWHDVTSVLMTVFLHQSPACSRDCVHLPEFYTPTKFMERRRKRDWRCSTENYMKDKLCIPGEINQKSIKYIDANQKSMF